MLHLNTISPEMHEALVSLSSDADLQSFALAGGTSLALRFGHRISVDIDFFSTTQFDPILQSEILEAGYAGYKFLSNNKYMLFCTINGVKTDFVYHPQALLQPFETIENIRLFSLQDVTAMKLKAIAQRGSKKDFYDLWQLLQVMTPDELMQLYAKKYGPDQTWMLLTSVTYFEDAELNDDPSSLEKMLTWQKAKQDIRKAFEGFKL
jgi:predicted nucleotidyltransferase component of viral defense system